MSNDFFAIKNFLYDMTNVPARPCGDAVYSVCQSLETLFMNIAVLKFKSSVCPIQVTVKPDLF